MANHDHGIHTYGSYGMIYQRFPKITGTQTWQWTILYGMEIPSEQWNPKLYIGFPTAKFVWRSRSQLQWGPQTHLSALKWLDQCREVFTELAAESNDLSSLQRFTSCTSLVCPSAKLLNALNSPLQSQVCSLGSSSCRSPWDLLLQLRQMWSGTSGTLSALPLVVLKSLDRNLCSSTSQL